MNNQIQIKVPFDEDIKAFITKKLNLKNHSWHIVKKSLDLRGLHRFKKPRFLVTIQKGTFQKQSFSLPKITKPLKDRVIIVGAGPAGLFASLILNHYKIKNTIIEQGGDVRSRLLDISRYWRQGHLNPENNVCYGEGGAGLFSDGKLITRIKSPYRRFFFRKNGFVWCS